MLGLAATVPFDDRYNQNASLDDLSLRLIQQHPQDVGSDLLPEVAVLSMEVLGRRMNIVGGPSEAVGLPVHEEFLRSEEWGRTEQHDGQQTVQDKLLKSNERESPTEQDTEQVGHLVQALTREMRRHELQDLLRITHRPHFVETHLNPALEAGLIEMTLPDKPTSRNQRYRRTSAGEALARQLTESSK